MFEYTALVDQTVNPGESVLFTVTLTECPCGCVRHFNGEGGFVLSGNIGTRPGCRCRQRTRQYFAEFGANVGIPEGGTAAPVSLAFAREGEVIPYTTMTVNPAVGDLANVSRATQIPVWAGCCQTVSVRNTGTEPITVSAPTLTLVPQTR